ncbi:MAG TPA: hypothetical protein DEP72_02750 [Clostridiales bacterium]|nr:MAG: hypothetical protein A2Y18_08155 [Clostridiales bacterium GWD2_32_19]HCC07074.1 hypothetical protein [Clostridiales bacterium]
MKRLKRALASILAVAMLATSINVSFAASTNFTDVDSKYSTAVTRLASIDILTGYEDGTFKPEGTITRAEAAAVMVRMLGKEKLAGYSAGLTQFSDMTGHWANGYVNVAAGAGLVKGYEDGTYKPDAQVTYAETVTMMVRALGAGEAVGAQGVWPNNYLNFALVEGLTDDVAVVPNAPAVRGDVAIMANTTLDAQLWEATGYNTDGTRTYAKYDDKDSSDEIIEKTLFTEKLELTKLTMKTITAKLGEGTLDVDQFKANGATYTFAENMAQPVVTGLEVDLWLNDDNDVVMVQIAEDSKQELVSFVDVTDVAADTIKVKLANGDEEKYDLADVVGYSLDGETAVKADIDEELDLQGKLILDEDNEVAVVHATEFTEYMIVDEIDIDEEDVTIDPDSDIRTSSASLTYDTDEDVTYIYDAKGKTLTFADIKAGDAVVYTTNEEYIMVLEKEAIEGTVDGDDTGVIEIDGTEYDISPNFTVNVNVDDEVAAYLDAMGQVVFVDELTSAGATGDYGIIVDFYSLEGDRDKTEAKIEILDLATGEPTGMKIFDAEETDEEIFSDKTVAVPVVYDFYETADGTDLDAIAEEFDETVVTANLVGKVVKYEVQDTKIVIYDVDTTEVSVGTAGIDVSVEKFTVAAGGVNDGTYYVNGEEVVVYDADKLDGDGILEVDKVSWSTLEDQSEAVVLVEIDDDNDEAKFVYFTDKLDSLVKTNDDAMGIIVDAREITSNDVKLSVLALDGTTLTLYVDEDDWSDVDALLAGTGYNSFEGALISYGAKDADYITKDDITVEGFAALEKSKLYELNDRGEYEFLADPNGEVKVSGFANVLVLNADITPEVTGVVGVTEVKGVYSVDITTNIAIGDTITIAGKTLTAVAATPVVGTSFVPGVDADATRTEILAALVGFMPTNYTVTADGVDASTLVLTQTNANLTAPTVTTVGTGVVGVVTQVTLPVLPVTAVTAVAFNAKDLEVAELSAIETAKDTLTTFAASETAKDTTVYYYSVKTNDDGELVDLTEDGTDDAVVVIIFDKDQF